MWINGNFTVSDSAEGLIEAKAIVNKTIRSYVDLDEFPNFKSEYNFDFLTDTVFDSRDEAEMYMNEKKEAWTRNYNPVVRYKENSNTMLLIGYEEYVI